MTFVGEATVVHFGHQEAHAEVVSTRTLQEIIAVLTCSSLADDQSVSAMPRSQLTAAEEADLELSKLDL